MNTHSDKTQENKSQSVANAVAQKQNNGESTFQFVDNRPEAVAQQKLQEDIKNSPKVQRLKVYQKMADKVLKDRSENNKEKTILKVKPSINLNTKERNINENSASDQRNDTINSNLKTNHNTNTNPPSGIPGGALGITEFSYDTGETTHVHQAETRQLDLNVVLNVTASWDTQSLGNTDILSENSNDVTEQTWSQIYMDLYPNSIGKPKRQTYWNSKFVERHEKVHVKDGHEAIKKGTGETLEWLNRQTIDASEGKSIQPQINVLTQHVVSEARRHNNEDYGAHIVNHDDRPGERRAYGDGKSLYWTLTQKIRAIARKNNWNYQDVIKKWRKED